MASPDLVWQLVRNHNSFMVKRNGVVLSSEPNNVANVHSFKFSGLAARQTLGLSQTDKGVSFTTRSRKNQNKPNKSFNSVSLNRDLAALPSLCPAPASATVWTSRPP